MDHYLPGADRAPQARTCLALALAAALVACGGGGGGGGDPAPAPAPAPDPTPDPDPAPAPTGDQAISTTYDRAFWQDLGGALAQSRATTAGQLYNTPPIIDSCDPGRLTQAAIDRYLETLNAARALHGLAPVTHRSGADTDAQAGALIQRANNYLEHEPDPGDACYSDAAARGAAGNLFGGGSTLVDPAWHVAGWLEDRLTVDAQGAAIGHRLSFLNPELAGSTYGQVDGYSVGAADASVGRNSVPEGLAFVAYPYREMPSVLAPTVPDQTGDGETRHLKWSFSLYSPLSTGAPFDYRLDRATVTVTRDDTGEVLAITGLEARYKGGYGFIDTLIWEVRDAEYGVEYEVTVSNIGADQLDGDFADSYRYPVLIEDVGIDGAEQ